MTALVGLTRSLLWLPIFSQIVKLSLGMRPVRAEQNQVGVDHSHCKRRRRFAQDLGWDRPEAGEKIGHASAFDVAALTFGISAMLGFLQGQVVWESENLPPGGFLETIKGMMPMMESVFTDMSRRISSKNYSGDQASLEAYSVVTKQLVSWCQDRGSDHTIPDSYLSPVENHLSAVRQSKEK
jgi:hypothetical protein